MKQQHWLENPSGVKKLRGAFIAVLAICLIAGFFVDLHPHFEVDKLPGFNAIFAFIACLLIILGAKVLGFILRRGESYYAEDERDA